MTADVPALVNRIRGEFLEMPGLRLTPAEASRFVGARRAGVTADSRGSGFNRLPGANA